ncbi:DNA replication protein [Sporosarcina luteola]|nr:DNA replication protein [Sporosarcina luteola]
MQQEERLRTWIEQGNVTISQLFFQRYKSLGIKDVDAMLIIQMMSFQSAGVMFPIPAAFADRMQLTEKEVTDILQYLMRRGYLSIDQSEDEKGVLHETFSLLPLWSRIMEQIATEQGQAEEQNSCNEEGEIFTLFEQEFGRLLSPMECETISMWLDQDGHGVEIIRAALKEAVLAQKLSLRYIDRILFEWKKKNVKTLADIERNVKPFRASIGRPMPKREATSGKIHFYNWLEERE